MLFGDGLDHVVITVPLGEGTRLHLLWQWPSRAGTRMGGDPRGKGTECPWRAWEVGTLPKALSPFIVHPRAPGGREVRPMEGC